MSNEELAIAYQHGGPLLPLWTQVERLAVRMVQRYLYLAQKNRAADFEDLMQAAFLGVERAARAFCEDRGSFASVMDYYVKGEVSALLGLRGRVRQEHYESVSASTPIREDSAATVGDMIADDDLPEPDADMFREDVRRGVRAAVDRLPEAQAVAVRGYDLDGVRQGELAVQMGVSDERVRQIRRKGWNGLQRDRMLRDLADDMLGGFWWHKSVAAFNRDWTSSTEAAALRLCK